MKYVVAIILVLALLLIAGIIWNVQSSTDAVRFAEQTKFTGQLTEMAR
jgi:uncharacterized membrane protein YciS (DUF1049 family)